MVKTKKNVGSKMQANKTTHTDEIESHKINFGSLPQIMV